MVDKRVKPEACWEFEAEVLVLHHPTTMSPKYQAMGEKNIIRHSVVCGFIVEILANQKARLSTILRHFAYDFLKRKFRFNPHNERLGLISKMRVSSRELVE